MMKQNKEIICVLLICLFHFITITISPSSHNVAVTSLLNTIHSFIQYTKYCLLKSYSKRVSLPNKKHTQLHIWLANEESARMF